MTSLTKVIGAAALAALLVAPQAMAREGRGGGGYHGGGNTAFGASGISRGVGSSGIARLPRGGGNESFGAAMNRGGAIRGGGYQSRGPRNNFDGFKGPGRKYSGNWDGPRRHHHGHRRGGLRFYSYGAPYFYDDYYDYGYASWDDDDVSCSYYWRKYQQTGSPRWRARYYDCVS